MKNETLLEKLGRLSAVRTVRTDQLHTAVRALCEKLDECTLDGDNIRIGEYGLASVRLRSNVGSIPLWQFSYERATYSGTDREYCYLERAVGSEGYLHGDFNCPLRGPTRGELIAFAGVAPKLVEGLVRNAENSAERLAAASEAVEAVTATL